MLQNITQNTDYTCFLYVRKCFMVGCFENCFKISLYLSSIYLSIEIGQRVWKGNSQKRKQERSVNIWKILNFISNHGNAMNTTMKYQFTPSQLENVWCWQQHVDGGECGTTQTFIQQRLLLNCSLKWFY